ATRQHRRHRALVDVDDMKREPGGRPVELVQETAADDQHPARRGLDGDLAQEPPEVALGRPVVQRPGKLPRPPVVGEVVGLGHRTGSLASAISRYSYAVGVSTGTSGSDTAHCTRFATGASSARGNRRASLDG